MHLLAQNPDQRRIWQDDLEGVTPTAVEEIVRVASPVTFMRRTATTDVSCRGHDFAEGDRVVLLLRRRQPRPAGLRRPRAIRRAAATRTPTSASGVPDLTSASAPTSPAGSWRSSSASCSTRLPDIEVIGDPVPLDALGIPLVGGIKRLPVRFTPTAKVGS